MHRTVAALQKNASFEVTDLVKRGMVRRHEIMMKKCRRAHRKSRTSLVAYRAFSRTHLIALAKP